MQRLEVSGAVRPLKWPLGVKWLIAIFKEASSHIQNAGRITLDKLDHFKRGIMNTFSISNIEIQI
jgi:hypothetical protein